jgi:hypothetical protein
MISSMVLSGEQHVKFIHASSVTTLRVHQKASPGARLERRVMLRARAFKTAVFARQASQAGISDAMLCKAFAQALLGQSDSLGGGVFKKRLNDNRHRSIILARGGHFGVFEFLYAKQDKTNLRPDELNAFRLLAQKYQRLEDRQLNALIANQYFMEICCDQANDIQK